MSVNMTGTIVWRHDVDTIQLPSVGLNLHATVDWDLDIRDLGSHWLIFLLTEHGLAFVFNNLEV